MVIMHNMKAMNAERQMNVVTADKAKSTEKLSSGYRINRSADDAAGLSISEKMRHQIRGLDRGSANIEEGVGYCQVADGALNEMHDMLQRMNELCIQAANGTLSESDRGDIDEEIQQLKAELQRICDTTKFNEEYIFRCEDVIPEKPHDVYRLNFSGKPKDLFIYNTSYDPDTYAGVAFRGRRYTWDEISPSMYDKASKTFRKGEYAIRADDGTVLSLVCEDGAKLPQVSRKFRTSADGRGIYINNDLAYEWESTKGPGDTYSFNYHGMTISFTRDKNDSFDDMVLKMTGTVWESTYEMPVEAYSVDAAFSYGTNYRFTSNVRIGTYLNNNEYVRKYILHAVDINKGGRIPYDLNGDGISDDPFDGVWLEGTNENGTPNGQVVLDTTSGVSIPCAMTWEEFGFDCKEDKGKHDWSNLTTDIWVGAGSIKDDPKADYPADSANGVNKGDQIFADYDPYKTFSFQVYNNSIAPPDNAENVQFYFSVINEVSKEKVVNTLNGVNIGYTDIKPHDEAKVDSDTANHPKVTNTGKTLNLLLKDEYNLGRDYENKQAVCELKGNSQLQYSGGTFSLLYGYDRTGGTMTFSGSSNLSVYTLKNNIITGGTISSGGRLSGLSTDITNPSMTISLRSASGSTMSLSYRYDIGDFFSGGGAIITESPDDANGRYVKIGSRYYEYRYWDPNHQNIPRYNVEITNSAGQRLEDYISDTVYPDIAAATQVSLHTKDYPTGELSGVENPRTAMVTRWQTPFQHPHIIPLEEPPEKPEYLRIQCSSNTIDNIWIQKQKLSVYRLGLSNVRTLSAAQATGCIDTVGAALSKVSSVRSLFGAEQNRLEHAYDINRNTHENTQSAESKIRDTDMAKEMIKYSNANILEQSGSSMLVQANQANNIVLSLLQ